MSDRTQANQIPKSSFMQIAWAILAIKIGPDYRYTATSAFI